MDRTGLRTGTLVAGGILFIALAFYLVPHPGETGYVTYVDQYERDTVPEEAQQLDHDALSGKAKSAFELARDSASGRAVVYGVENRPPEFEYTHDIRLYVIRDGGEQYAVRTAAQSNLFNFREYSFSVLVAIGLVSLALGARRTYRRIGE